MDELGIVLIEGTNPEFGNAKITYSHQLEIFGILPALLFVDEYCRYFFLKFESNRQYYCDNLEVINKLKEIKKIDFMINYINQYIMMLFF